VIKLTIPIEPKGQKRFRAAAHGGHARTYKDSEQARYEGKIAALLAQHRPEFPLEGPLSVTVRCYLPIPQSKPKGWKHDAKLHLIRPTGKPDVSNLLKNIEDVMNGVFWRDDAQIIRAAVTKWYGDNPRWEIEIEEVTP